MENVIRSCPASAGPCSKIPILSLILSLPHSTRISCPIMTFVRASLTLTEILTMRLSGKHSVCALCSCAWSIRLTDSSSSPASAISRNVSTSFSSAGSFFPLITRQTMISPVANPVRISTCRTSPVPSFSR